METEVEKFSLLNFLQDGQLDDVSLGTSFEEVKYLWGDTDSVFSPNQPLIFYAFYNVVYLSFDKNSDTIISVDIPLDNCRYPIFNLITPKILDYDFLDYNLSEEKAGEYLELLQMPFDKQTNKSLPNGNEWQTVFKLDSKVKMNFVTDYYECQGLQSLSLEIEEINNYINQIPKYRYW